MIVVGFHDDCEHYLGNHEFLVRHGPIVYLVACVSLRQWLEVVNAFLG